MKNIGAVSFKRLVTCSSTDQFVALFLLMSVKPSHFTHIFEPTARTTITEAYVQSFLQKNLRITSMPLETRDSTSTPGMGWGYILNNEISNKKHTNKNTGGTKTYHNKLLIYNEMKQECRMLPWSAQLSTSMWEGSLLHHPLCSQTITKPPSIDLEIMKFSELSNWGFCCHCRNTFFLSYFNACHRNHNKSFDES